MTGTVQLHTDAIAQDMIVLQQAMERISFNSQQIIEHLSQTPPPEMVPGMKTEALVDASKAHATHDLRVTIARRMNAAIERTGTQVRHCVAHCEAAIDILMGVE